MAVRTVTLPEIGEVVLSKRKGAKYIRLTMDSSGKVRVGMPQWAPYAAGISFAKKRKDWIIKQRALRPLSVLEENSQIGKAHRLHYYPAKNNKAISTQVTKNVVHIFTDLPARNEQVQAKAAAAAERALLSEAKILLPQRLMILAEKHSYFYKEVRIRKLTSRWGSCSSVKVISLSYYLIQLPWHLIDYVLAHELVHTQHLNHSRLFWDELQSISPDARQLRKEIKDYNPRVEVL